jgi:ABC-type dipeptide/oligopeptide/nickel transport system permease component
VFDMIWKRLLSLIIILFGLSILTFGLTYLLPSDPVEELVNSMGGGHDEETIARLETQFGTSRPFMEQYADWIKGVVLEQDFGISVKYNEPVKDIIARKLPNTVALACTSFVVMLLIALPLGILSAVYKNHIVDYVIRFMSFIGVSMPSFWFGMILIWILAVHLGWLPVAGSSSWKHIVMPTLTLAVGMSCSYIRRIRAVMVEQMQEEYISGCKSRGMGKVRIILFHVLPNSLLAIVTMLGMSFGSLLGGTMLVEMVFSWNGIGQICTSAITSRDYALIQGYVMWMGFIYVMVNLLVDISYSFIDPRIRRGILQK